MNEEKMTLKESVRLTLRAWRFYWKNTPRFVLSTVLWALADAVSPYAVVWFSARLVAELSDARDPQALAVDVAWVLGVTPTDSTAPPRIRNTAADTLSSSATALGLPPLQKLSLCWMKL